MAKCIFFFDTSVVFLSYQGRLRLQKVDVQFLNKVQHILQKSMVN